MTDSELYLQYFRSIARLHGQVAPERWTEEQALQVAALCPTPVASFDAWKQSLGYMDDNDRRKANSAAIEALKSRKHA